MLCQICHAAEATVYFIETITQKQVSLHLCESCAQKRHLGEIIGKPAMAIHELLASILQLGALPMADATEVKCTHCGLDYVQFTRSGRFGCAHCYDSFRDHLLPLLRQFHQAEEHRGRRSEPETPAKDRLAALKAKVHQAIADEDYETAARLRDQIKSLEGAGNS
jgi:protein arginine kinase activator